MIQWFLWLIGGMIVMVLGCLGVWWVLGQTSLPHNVKVLIVALVAILAAGVLFSYIGVPALPRGAG